MLGLWRHPQPRAGFFGLGGYCMAMFLKLEASDPQSTKIQSTPGIPDFMDWNQLTELPLFWEPFHSIGFTLVAVVAVPMLLALIVGLAMFKRRVGDVYFSIVTQAIAAILTILIIGQQGLTGGVNGITDLRTLMGWDIRSNEAKTLLYFVCACLLLGCILIGRSFSPQARPVADGDARQEERVRFSGYDVASFKIFVFCVAAAFAGIGGAVHAAGRLYVAELRRHRAVDRDGDIRRGRWAHVAARRGIRRAAGQLRQDIVLRKLPELWLYFMGGLFIAVVMYFPNGLAGLWQSHGRKWLMRLARRRSSARTVEPATPRPLPPSAAQPASPVTALETTP